MVNGSLKDAVRLVRTARLYARVGLAGITPKRAYVMLRYWILTALFRRKIPWLIEFSVTYRCQCRCKHCSVSNYFEEVRTGKRIEFTTDQIDAVLQQAVKMGIPKVDLFGGEHISALPDYCLDDCPELDICVIGEGEEVFVKLLDALEKKEQLSEVPGLVYRLPGAQAYYHTPRAVRIRDIDKIPMPAWDLTPIENYLSRELNYHVKRGRTIPMLATRGCPYKCSFCSNSNMWGNPWLARNPRLVADEMELYIDRY